MIILKKGRLIITVWTAIAFVDRYKKDWTRLFTLYFMDVNNV